MSDQTETASPLEQNANDNDRFRRVPIPRHHACLRRARIRLLNDALRVTGQGGCVVVTDGIAALGPERVDALLLVLAAFTDFTADNDPWGEHDCGALSVGGERALFKIDYFDRSLRGLSPDPADPTVTIRVLTIMRADEY